MRAREREKVSVRKHARARKLEREKARASKRARMIEIKSEKRDRKRSCARALFTRVSVCVGEKRK